jgi:hypothetical protein
MNLLYQMTRSWPAARSLASPKWSLRLGASLKGLSVYKRLGFLRVAMLRAVLRAEAGRT